eukprot:106363-Chlamydomonas_euryale.AAC.1
MCGDVWWQEGAAGDKQPRQPACSVENLGEVQPLILARRCASGSCASPWSITHGRFPERYVCGKGRGDSVSAHPDRALAIPTVPWPFRTRDMFLEIWVEG